MYSWYQLGEARSYHRDHSIIAMGSNEQLIRAILIIIALILLLPLLMMLVAWPLMGMWDGGHMWGWGSEPVSILVLMWMIPLLVLLVGGYFLYRVLTSSSSEGSDPALEELRLAYARGDLTYEEFEERQDQLRAKE